MVWKKGQSGNPGGKPKLGPSVREQLTALRELARQHAPEAIKAIVEEIGNVEKPDIRLRASAELLRWAYGDPAKVEPDAQPGDQALAQMPREDRIAFLEAALAHERGEDAKVVALPSLALLPPQKPA
jgi:acyl-CoA reductase-like NAD-dependent aldehyde dehydrogenase